MNDSQAQRVFIEALMEQERQQVSDALHKEAEARFKERARQRQYEESIRAAVIQLSK